MLDGTWIPQAAQFGGEAIPLPDARFVIDGDRYVIEAGGGGAREEGRLTIDASVAPARIDLLGVDGPHAGQAIPAIFRLRGNLLQLCYLVGKGDGGGSRPRTLDSPPGSMQVLIRYRRED